MNLAEGVTLARGDYVVATAACGCSQACRRDSYKQCSGKNRGLALEIRAHDASDVIKCLCCDNESAGKQAKALIADIKSHVDAKPGVDWLAVVELPLTVHSGTPQRADLTLIPRQAQTMHCAVVVEVDPALHFRNPSRHRVRQRRGVSALDSARDAACDRDAAKDDRYRALGVHLLRIGEEAWIPGQGLASHWLQLLDSMLDAAAASCI
jgi:hypothetical protein